MRYLLREETKEGKLQMLLLSLRPSGLDSWLKEVRVFKVLSLTGAEQHRQSDFVTSRQIRCWKTLVS